MTECDAPRPDTDAHRRGCATFTVKRSRRTASHRTPSSAGFRDISSHRYLLSHWDMKISSCLVIRTLTRRPQPPSPARRARLTRLDSRRRRFV